MNGQTGVNAPLSNRQNKLAMIHVAKKAVGIPDDAYRHLLEGAAGVRSAAEMEFEGQFKAVMKAFENLGFKGPAHRGIKKTDTRRGRNREFITARQEYYIRGLWDLASRRRSESSLRAMIRRIAGVDDVRFLPLKSAQKVILALRDIAEKAGFDPDERPNDGRNAGG